MHDLAGLIEAGDLNGLLWAVDALCEKRSWDELLELADRCDDALERGKQLWPISAHVEYRVALEAPPEYAAGVLEPGTGRFALGPLTEVAASTHTWAELAPFIEEPQVAAYVAQERVIRGEDLTDDDRCRADILEMPLKLQEWEPVYCAAAYKSTYVEVPEPWVPAAAMIEVHPARGVETLPDFLELETALLDLVQPWTAESNGAARALCIKGDAVAAAGALAADVLWMGALEPAEALQRMAWAAAGGGARGRRRGAAFGRYMAWYVATVVAGLEWPPQPGELRQVMEELNWYRWEEDVGRAGDRGMERRRATGAPGEPASSAPDEGWRLHLAVEDLDDEWAAAIAASDVLDDAD